jgi:hypothetical protein
LVLLYSWVMMTKSDKEVIDQLVKSLTNTKEKAPIRYKKPEVEVVFEPEPPVKLVINNKKGLL